MKKALRYWWVLVIGLVVVPPVAVLSAVPRGSGWHTTWLWTGRDFRFGSDHWEEATGRVKIHVHYYGFVSAVIRYDPLDLARDEKG